MIEDSKTTNNKTSKPKLTPRKFTVTKNPKVESSEEVNQTQKNISSFNVEEYINLDIEALKKLNLSNLSKYLEAFKSIKDKIITAKEALAKFSSNISSEELNKFLNNFIKEPLADLYKNLILDLSQASDRLENLSSEGNSLLKSLSKQVGIKGSVVFEKLCGVLNIILDPKSLNNLDKYNPSTKSKIINTLKDNGVLKLGEKKKLGVFLSSKIPDLGINQSDEYKKLMTLGGLDKGKNEFTAVLASLESNVNNDAEFLNKLGLTNLPSYLKSFKSINETLKIIDKTLEATKYKISQDDLNDLLYDLNKNKLSELYKKIIIDLNDEHNSGILFSCFKTKNDLLTSLSKQAKNKESEIVFDKLPGLLNIIMDPQSFNDSDKASRNNIIKSLEDSGLSKLGETFNVFVKTDLTE